MKRVFPEKYVSAWYLFLVVIFTPALMISMDASGLTVAETYNYSLGYIADNTFVWLGYLLYLPVGTIACLLPNDAIGLLVFVKMFFGDFAIYLFWVFIATTYPPFYRRNAIPGK